MAGNAGKTKIVVDTGVLADGDSIAAYLVAGGTQLTATGTALNVSITGTVPLPTGAATETTLASVLSELQAITFAEDSAHVSGNLGVMALSVRNDAGTSLVSADGDYAPLSVDAAGNLRVSGSFSFNEAGDYAEDAAHVSGDIGYFNLAVRQDTLANSTSADGDYGAFKINSVGSLYTNDTNAIAQLVLANASLDAIEATSGTTNTAVLALQKVEDAAHSSGDSGIMSLGVRNDDQATTATSANADYGSIAVDDRGAVFTKSTSARSNLQQIMTVGTTAVALPAAPLAKRSSMFVQMLSSGQLYLGSATVTNSGATRGLQIGNGGFVSLDVGPANLVYGVASAAGKDVAVWEFA